MCICVHIYIYIYIYNEAPLVRALVNTVVDYSVTNLAGQPNRLLLQLQTMTNLPAGGGIRIEAPEGFVFEENCVVLDNPMREVPFVDLRPAAALLCTSSVPYITNMPLVTIQVIRGEVRAELYEFMIDAGNPRWPQDTASMTWTIFALSSVETGETADLTATLQGFAIENEMRAGELLGTPWVNYEATRRDDHPEQRSFVVLAFELASAPPTDVESSTLMVKAPLGFRFASLCQVVIGMNVFGEAMMYPQDYLPFEATAMVDSCEDYYYYYYYYY